MLWLYMIYFQNYIHKITDLFLLWRPLMNYNNLYMITEKKTCYTTLFFIKKSIKIINIHLPHSLKRSEILQPLLKSNVSHNILLNIMSIFFYSFCRLECAVGSRRQWFRCHCVTYLSTYCEINDVTWQPSEHNIHTSCTGKQFVLIYYILVVHATLFAWP